MQYCRITAQNDDPETTINKKEIINVFNELELNKIFENSNIHSYSLIFAYFELISKIEGRINSKIKSDNYYLTFIEYYREILLYNIFTIKRAGDYLQIDYCKKNNYIFISNDKMSASFCFLENCNFIGPFGDCGIFIKNSDFKLCKGTINDDITFEQLSCETEPSEINRILDTTNIADVTNIIEKISNPLKRKQY